MKVNYWIIYTLKLKDNCWYVGSTTSLAFKRRMKAHWTGSGSKWTSTHSPERIYDIDVFPRELSSQQIALLEDKQTLKIVAERGTYCVRGGGYCQTIIEPSWPIDIIKSKKVKRRNKKNKTWDVRKAKRELAASTRLLM